MKIIIFGFTGSGKSTYLNKLEQEQKLVDHSFLDLDEVIFNKYSQGVSSLAELINKKGWSWFRDIELKEINLLLSLDNIVISLGGGSVSKELVEMIETSRDIYGHFIDESFLTCWNRIKNDHLRPIVNNGEERCKVLYNERKLLFKDLEKVCLKY